MDHTFSIGDRVHYDGPRWHCVGTIVRMADNGAWFQVRTDSGVTYRAESPQELTLVQG